jgi:transcriptional regulator with XRE-family HTH domain
MRVKREPSLPVLPTRTHGPTANFPPAVLSLHIIALLVSQASLICDIILIRDNNVLSHIKPKRLKGLPAGLRRELIEVRHRRGWSQAELGQRLGLPQMHISAIETGKIVPRFDTLLDLVRVLDRDLLLVPRTLVPAVQALIRDQRRPDHGTDADEGERSLYADDLDEGEERR